MEVLAVQDVGESNCPPKDQGTALVFSGDSNCIYQGRPDQIFVGTIESEWTNKREEELSLSVAKWLEGDTSVAVWVKWGGKWHAGIRCARADWPLSALKAKPTHNMKNYLIIFFPHTKNYAWVDSLLLQPISEFPEPMAYTTHDIGREMVKDLAVAQHFIMQNLAIAMLNMVDHIHIEALKETARAFMIWEEFAMEASHCLCYSDLGRVLLKLQNMILQQYINSEWLQNSCQFWANQCETACSAETVETLKEELNESILWDRTKILGDTSQLCTVGSEWKTWKQKAMKCFSTSHPLSSCGDVGQENNDDLVNQNSQVSRKRPKLEVRRADANITHIGAEPLNASRTAEIDSEIFSSREAANGPTLASEPCKEGDSGLGVTPVDSSALLPDKWGELPVEAENSDAVQIKSPLIPVKEVVITQSKNRQCIAFVKSKGRQCVRWANEGDDYCCVHLTSCFVNNSPGEVGTPSASTQMCEGTTVLGNRCKHRSLSGSSFCKKHRTHNDAKPLCSFPGNSLERNHEEGTPISDASNCKEMVLFRDVDRPLQVDPVSVVGADILSGRSGLITNLEHSTGNLHVPETLKCIGSFPHDACTEVAKKYSLYCEEHLPKWLKRARDGKSRLISKDVFLDFLNSCQSREQKLHLHEACELFYKLFRSLMSLRNPAPKETQFQWAVTEAQKNSTVGELFTKLVSKEKERLIGIWDFGAEKNAQITSMEEKTLFPSDVDSDHYDRKAIICKICSQEFFDEKNLANHWMTNHKKEAQWLFRGYACALCLDSFTNKKVLETHVQDRHHSPFIDNCMLLRCILCGSHFGNSEDLWLHVFSVHPADFQAAENSKQQYLTIVEVTQNIIEPGSPAPIEDNTENVGTFRKFVCRFCGLKFDLLPDLGRHHQAAHMNPNTVGFRSSKRGVRHHAYRLKSGRLSRPKFKKSLGAASYRIRNQCAANLSKQIQAAKLISVHQSNAQPLETDAASLGQLGESHCSGIAKYLFANAQKANPRPNSAELLSFARSACCKSSLSATLEEKYGVLPENLYLKAAKLCSEQNIQVIWHQEGYICPQGCKPEKEQQLWYPVTSRENVSEKDPRTHLSVSVNYDWEVDESHYVIDSRHLRTSFLQKKIVLCLDLSFGREPVPVACVADEALSDSMPWESFVYVTKPLLHGSISLDTEIIQERCTCPHSTCLPEECDHVYLFGTDCLDARDIYGKPMQGRFPYDENGRIILEEGYVVYECNHQCGCNRSCQNRVLQNGVRVKLEVFKTEKKGWGLRAGETILRGTFICEYIGEVLDEHEAEKRRHRYDKEGSGHFYVIDAHNNDMSRLVGNQVPYVIDATTYGNVSRFINHSCSPNLVTYQVLVESGACQQAHIGLYASQDISMGEELTCNYRCEWLSQEGYPCHSGVTNCRGRLY